MIQKELSIFIIIFLFLAAGMHFSAWIDHPIEHIKALSHSSLGVLHPLYLSLGMYGVILFIRLIIKLIKRMTMKTIKE